MILKPILIFRWKVQNFNRFLITYQQIIEHLTKLNLHFVLNYICTYIVLGYCGMIRSFTNPHLEHHLIKNSIFYSINITGENLITNNILSKPIYILYIKSVLYLIDTIRTPRPTEVNFLPLLPIIDEICSCKKINSMFTRNIIMRNAFREKLFRITRVNGTNMFSFLNVCSTL